MSHIISQIQYAPEDVEVVILGNKSDVGDERVISKEAGEEVSILAKFFNEEQVNNKRSVKRLFYLLKQLKHQKCTSWSIACKFTVFRTTRSPTGQ